MGSVVIIATSYAWLCAVIQARTSLTFQAVTRALNLVGLGNLPNFTMRHSVGAEKGRGAMALSPFFGLRTSWATRSQALSGSRSNTAVVGAVVAAGKVTVGLVFNRVIVVDMSWFLKKETRFFQVVSSL